MGAVCSRDLAQFRCCCGSLRELLMGLFLIAGGLVAVLQAMGNRSSFDGKLPFETISLKARVPYGIAYQPPVDANAAHSSGYLVISELSSEIVLIDIATGLVVRTVSTAGILENGPGERPPKSNDVARSRMLLGICVVPVAAPATNTTSTDAKQQQQQQQLSFGIAPPAYEAIAIDVSHALLRIPLQTDTPPSVIRGVTREDVLCGTEPFKRLTTLLCTPTTAYLADPRGLYTVDLKTGACVKLGGTELVFDKGYAMHQLDGALVSRTTDAAGVGSFVALQALCWAPNTRSPQSVCYALDGPRVRRIQLPEQDARVWELWTGGGGASLLSARREWLAPSEVWRIVCSYAASSRGWVSTVCAFDNGTAKRRDQGVCIDATPSGHLIAGKECFPVIYAIDVEGMLLKTWTKRTARGTSVPPPTDSSPPLAITEKTIVNRQKNFVHQLAGWQHYKKSPEDGCANDPIDLAHANAIVVVESLRAAFFTNCHVSAVRKLALPPPFFVRPTPPANATGEALVLWNRRHEHYDP